MRRALWILVGASALACSGSACSGDDTRSHFSQLDQINTSNVANLKIAWAYHSGGADTVKNTTQIQHNPLIINGVLYGASPDVSIFGLDAATGN